MPSPLPQAMWTSGIAPEVTPSANATRVAIPVGIASSSSRNCGLCPRWIGAHRFVVDAEPHDDRRNALREVREVLGAHRRRQRFDRRAVALAHVGRERRGQPRVVDHRRIAVDDPRPRRRTRTPPRRRRRCGARAPRRRCECPDRRCESCRVIFDAVGDDVVAITAFDRADRDDDRAPADRFRARRCSAAPARLRPQPESRRPPCADSRRDRLCRARSGTIRRRRR